MYWFDALWHLLSSRLSLLGRAFHKLGSDCEKEESLSLLPFQGGSSLGGPVEERRVRPEDRTPIMALT